MSPLANDLRFRTLIRKCPIKLDLTRVNLIGSAAGFNFKSKFVFTIAGTNGKGTTARALEALLLENRFSVGTFLSPEFHDCTDMFRINGNCITENLLNEGLAAVEDLIFSHTSNSDDRPTSFEHLTLTALWLFDKFSKERTLEILILEVGMGGVFDAVNWVDPDVAVLTRVAMDHEAFLGHDRESIGRIKAGIFRPHKLAVLGETKIPRSVIEAATTMKSRIARRGVEWIVEEMEKEWNLVIHFLNFTVSHIPKPDNLPFDNAALAAAVLSLSWQDLRQRFSDKLLPKTLPTQSIKQAMKASSLPGRFQQLIISQLGLQQAHINQDYIGASCVIPVWSHSATDKVFIIDVGHNLDAAAWVFDKLQSLSNPILCIAAICDDKPIEKILGVLIPAIEEWILVSLSHLSDRFQSSLARAHSYLEEQSAKYREAGSIFSAVFDALKNPCGVVLCFGSFLLAREVTNILKKTVPGAFPT